MVRKILCGYALMPLATLSISASEAPLAVAAQLLLALGFQLISRMLRGLPGRSATAMSPRDGKAPPPVLYTWMMSGTFLATASYSAKPCSMSKPPLADGVVEPSHAPHTGTNSDDTEHPGPVGGSGAGVNGGVGACGVGLGLGPMGAAGSGTVWATGAPVNEPVWSKT